MKNLKLLLTIFILTILLSSCENSKEVEKVSKTETGTIAVVETSTDTTTQSGVDNNLINNQETMTNKIVKKGDNIAVSYTGKLEDGTVFDATSKHGGTPLEFKAGAGQMIKGFDAGVIGMKVGETKSIEMEPKDAYGEYDETKKQVVPREQLKDFEKAGYKIEKGAKVYTQMGELTILEANEKEVTLDTNHTLAGKKLIFEVKLEEIK